MSKVALYVPLEAIARQGNRKSRNSCGQPAAGGCRSGTVTWYAIQRRSVVVRHFDTFNDEAGRETHLERQGGGGVDG